MMTIGKLLYINLLILLIILQQIQKINALIRFSNANCTLYDQSVAEIKECRIKAVDRNRAPISIKIHVKKVINTFRVHFKIMKKANGWHPFLYDMTVDMCDFFRRPKKYMVLFVIFYEVRNHINFNHTCPYKPGEDIIVDSFDVDESGFLNKYPIDTGEYAVISMWYGNEKLVLSTDISASYKDYKKMNK